MSKHSEFIYKQLEEVENDPNLIIGKIVKSYNHLEDVVAFYYTRYDNMITVIGHETTSVDYANEVLENGTLDFIKEQLRKRDFEIYKENFTNFKLFQ